MSPLEFPGGDIGSLAVHGTLNDVAMMGAHPVCLTAGFVLEEGLPLDILEPHRAIDGRCRAARRRAARRRRTRRSWNAARPTGCTSTPPGVALAHPDFRPAPHRATAGDVVIVSGAIGRHGMAIMAAREGLAFETTITSDSACLVSLVNALRTAKVDVHVLRDPTRGGVATALNEIAAASGVGIEIDEDALPVPDDVRAACEVLGLDPLYVANEGVLLAFVPRDALDRTLSVLRAHPLGRDATQIARVIASHPGMVSLRTALGGTRIVDKLPGDQLPRIC